MKPKQLTYILGGVLIGLIVIGIGGFVYGQQQLSIKIQKIKKISSDIKLQTQELEHLAKLEKNYQQIAPLDQKAQSVLPAQKQQSEVIAQITTLIKRNGMSIDGLTFEKTSGLPDEKSQTQPGEVGGILVMPVKFQATASYLQMIGLLTSFEQQERYMQVTNLDITRQEDKLLVLNISLNVFLKP
jgi:Tfp pilus assembly protein PilN